MAYALPPYISMRFIDKTVIVTGAGSGIGLAIAHRFSSEGAKVVLADINMEQLKKTAAVLGAPDVNKYWLSECDVSNEQQVEATVAGGIERFGTLDIIVNNAGLMIFKKLEECNIY